MILSLILIGTFLPHLVLGREKEFDIQDVCFIVLTQENKYHGELYLKIEKDIQKQVKELNLLPANILKSYKIQENEVGHWTIFPLLEKLPSLGAFEWILFIEESTKISLKKLIKVLRKYNSSEELFVGYVLQDNDPTIIHHFADSASVLYPHFSAGFFITKPLLQKLISRLPVDEELSFSIDPKYEFAKFVWHNSKGVKLQHENQFCLTKIDENCATWIEEDFPDCLVIVPIAESRQHGDNVAEMQGFLAERFHIKELYKLFVQKDFSVNLILSQKTQIFLSQGGSAIPSDNLHVGVKTWHKFHQDRILAVKNTWASETKNLRIFSDYEDASIPTIKVNVENVAQGHCEKTLYIMKYYVSNNISLHWLAIVDDDTIISINRLRKLLTCYDASDTVILGERYGYGVANNIGYDYITGGGGMIFSLSAVKLLLDHCNCPSIDSPDDMIIGLCLKRLGITVTHSPYFHQARPTDYSPEFLRPLKHISFHKHWLINPYIVYQEWLQDIPDSVLHTEL